MATYQPGAWQFGTIATSYNYISSKDIVMPENGGELVKRFGSQSIEGFLEQIGRKKATNAIEYNHWEEDRIMGKVKATAAVAGDVYTFTMDASSKSSYDASSPYLDASPAVANNGYQVQKYDVLMIPSSSTTAGDGNVQIMVTSVNLSAGTFTAQPLLTGMTPAAIGSAIEIPVLYNAWPEGSGQPNSIETSVTKYTNQLQVIKNQYKISGTAKELELWFKVKGKDGREEARWAIKGETAEYIRHRNYREYALVTGEKITNQALITTLGDDGQRLQITTGLIPSAKASGIQMNYSSIAVLTLNDIDTFLREVDRQKGAKENWVMNGFNLRTQWSDLMADLTKEGGVNYGAFNGNKELAISLDFSSVQRNGYTLHLKTYDLLNEVQGLGATNFTFPDEAIIIPADSKVDPKTKEVMPSLQIRYLENREMDHWVRGKEQTNEDAYELNYLSHIGLQIFGIGRYGYISQA